MCARNAPHKRQAHPTHTKHGGGGLFETHTPQNWAYFRDWTRRTLDLDHDGYRDPPTTAKHALHRRYLEEICSYV